ncbi:Phytochrome A-associated F-box protein [Glycine soja]|nr:hypothetical protein JHK87_007992 [Glycine soja]KAG5055876.1 hypothetical protein JHK85_008386 [Glycine max]
MDSEIEKKKNLFSELTDDIVLNIFYKLEDDPRHWARLACVCTKFSSLVRDFCWKTKCSLTIPQDLLSAVASDPPLSLHKLSFCCPGLRHAGLLFDTSDFGLERDLGPGNFNVITDDSPSNTTPPPPPPPPQQQQQPPQSDDCSSSCWSLYDDLYYDTLYVPTESESPRLTESVSVRAGVDVASISACSKKRKLSRAWSSHLASGSWTLSREQGSKLLARKFRYDCLYVCEWPGCVHKEEKRKYCLFRGVFKNFRRTMVWRTIQDGKKRKMDLPCAFCACEFTWDLHSSFCLRPGFGFHDDGEPMVRAYVCENGHVSGAWTDLPIYT